MSDQTPAERPSNPPPLVVAASLVAIEGLALLGLALAEGASVEESRRSLGWSTAAFFAAYGVLLVVAGWALMRRQYWTRGPVLITQLILLGLAWNLRDHALLAILLLVTAAIVLAGMLHPASIDALDDTPQSSDSKD